MVRGTRQASDESSSEKARREVIEQRARLAQLEQDQAAAEAELATLQAGAGDAVLDAADVADAAGKLARAMQELRDRIDMTGRAAVVQRTRVTQAESAYLLAEADLLDQAAEEPRATLRRHQERTNALLEQLAEHECPYVPEHLLIDERSRHTTDRYDISWQRPKSEVLEDQVQAAELPVRILREMAADRDPAKLLQEAAGVEGRVGLKRPEEFYPACVWGPHALVPAPAYLRTVETLTVRLAQLRDTAVPAARRRITELEAALREAEEKGEVRQLKPGPPGPPGLSGRTLADKLAVAQQKLTRMLEDEQRVADELATLTGEPIDPRACAGHGRDPNSSDELPQGA